LAGLNPPLLSASHPSDTSGLPSVLSVNPDTGRVA
jgi:hypothetical protein